MSKRWSVLFDRPRLGEYGNLPLIVMKCDWTLAAPRRGAFATAHFAVTVALLGFGVCVIRWLDRDVYGDGGVA